jgi:hypothetical protein
VNFKKLSLWIIILLPIIGVACKKKDSVSIANKWEVNSIVESYDSIIKNAPAGIYIEFNDVKEITLMGDNFNCTTNFTIDGAQMVIDSISCDTCCVFQFQETLRSYLHKVNSYKVINEKLYLYGEKDLNIKSSLK